ncbi:MAG: hypothetical protein EOO09_05295 [Chitinophagaceae bacterium]|nr:MAG: hypothetical protein EOO09_05295 [Chitinophagaceae bacterium]
MIRPEREIFYPASAKEWRKWLKENHQSKQSVLLLCYKKGTGTPSVEWTHVVDEALCFGWIDSTRKSIGDGKFLQLITRRKPQSHWSKINKDKVERLIAGKKMAKAGLESIRIAKENGSWNKLDQVESLVIPKELASAFRAHPGSRKYFNGLSKSVKKMILHWVHSARRIETKLKRAEETASLAAVGERPKQFR